MADDANMQGHVETYSSVTRLLFWGAISCGVIAAIVIWLIS